MFYSAIGYKILGKMGEVTLRTRRELDGEENTTVRLWGGAPCRIVMRVS